MSPPLRSREHVDAVLAAMKDGTIDAIATDHAPHHADEKALEFDQAPFGITGWKRLSVLRSISYTTD